MHPAHEISRRQKVGGWTHHKANSICEISGRHMAGCGWARVEGRTSQHQLFRDGGDRVDNGWSHLNTAIPFKTMLTQSLWLEAIMGLHIVVPMDSMLKMYRHHS